jgi:hypothetical protein
LPNRPFCFVVLHKDKVMSSYIMLFVDEL